MNIGNRWEARSTKDTETRLEPANLSRFNNRLSLETPMDGWHNSAREKVSVVPRWKIWLIAFAGQRGWWNFGREKILLEFLISWNFFRPEANFRNSGYFVKLESRDGAVYFRRNWWWGRWNCFFDKIYLLFIRFKFITNVELNSNEFFPDFHILKIYPRRNKMSDWFRLIERSWRYKW